MTQLVAGADVPFRTPSINTLRLPWRLVREDKAKEEEGVFICGRYVVEEAEVVRGSESRPCERRFARRRRKRKGAGEEEFTQNLKRARRFLARWNQHTFVAQCWRRRRRRRRGGGTLGAVTVRVSEVDVASRCMLPAIGSK